MNVLNDRNPATVDTWVDDSGVLRNIVIVQNPGKPVKLYFDGIEIPLPQNDQVMRYHYHYCATKQLSPGSVTYIDGIADMSKSILDMNDYSDLKKLILLDRCDLGGTEGLTIQSLSLLHVVRESGKEGTANLYQNAAGKLCTDGTPK